MIGGMPLKKTNEMPKNQTGSHAIVPKRMGKGPKYPFTVYGRMFKLYMYTAIAPIPISTFAGEPSQSVGKNFIKSYAGVCLEGAIIALACIIFSVYAASPPAVGDTSLSAVTIVWNYIGELVFNLLVLVGAVKASDRIVKEMMGL